MIDTLGADLILVDEGHRYKNLIRKASGGSTEFTKLGFGDEEIERIAMPRSLGDIFKGMNNLRMNMISPALVKEKYEAREGIKIPELSKMVDSSPKLQVVCKTVIKVYNARLECGQVIYLPRGVKKSASVKNYLIKNGIPSKAIALDKLRDNRTSKTKNHISL